MVQGTLHWETTNLPTIQKMSFSIKDFSSKCEQIRRKLRIWSHLPKKSLMENFIFCAVSLIGSDTLTGTSIAFQLLK